VGAWDVATRCRRAPRRDAAARLFDGCRCLSHPRSIVAFYTAPSNTRLRPDPRCAVGIPSASRQPPAFGLAVAPVARDPAPAADRVGTRQHPCSRPSPARRRPRSRSRWPIFAGTAAPKTRCARATSSAAASAATGSCTRRGQSAWCSTRPGGSDDECASTRAWRGRLPPPRLPEMRTLHSSHDGLLST
jgi:hypothetical protein